MAIRGDDPHTMRQRSGHEHLETLEIYIRQAQAIRDGFGLPFRPLPAWLLGGTPSGPVSPADGNEFRQLLGIAPQSPKCAARDRSDLGIHAAG
jgi:hypothetical protein